VATKLADAVAYLKTDDSELKKGLDDGKSKVSGWGSALQGVLMGAGMAGFNALAGAAQTAVGYMGDAVAAASDMGETVSKTGVLFGDSSDTVLSWSENAAQAFGQSKQQALDAASTFATFGKAAGLAGDDLVNFSTDFVGLSSDLASFNNTTPEQAIEAIGAALRGESEPLRAYGVLLDDASMRQKALELGIIQTTKEALTPQQKVLAAQALIYEQTSAAQGDFARTSGGLANQQRILDAQMTNLQTTVGEALLPTMLALTSGLNSLVQTVLPPLTTFIRGQVVPAFQAITNIIGSTVGPMIAQAQTWFTGLGATMEKQANGPFAYVRKWFEENMPRIRQIVETVLTAIQTFWDAHGAKIMAVVQGLFGWMTRFWDTQMRTILDIVTAMLQLLTGDFEGAGQTLRGIVERWWSFISAAVTALLENIRRAFRSVDWGGIGRGIIEGIGNGIRNAAGWLADQARQAAWNAFESAKDALGIQSPSKVAADKIGVPFVEGIAVGMQRAMDGLRTDIAGGMSAMVSGLQPAGAAAGGVGGAMSITINVNGSDAGGVGVAARDGVLQALRAAGVR
jgi:hypothetical protein